MDEYQEALSLADATVRNRRHIHQNAEVGLVPSTFMYLSAGYEDERGEHPAHDPSVRFNEEVLPIGTACLTRCAVRWLENNR